MRGLAAALIIVSLLAACGDGSSPADVTTTSARAGSSTSSSSVTTESSATDAAAPCDPAAMLPVVQAAVGDPSSLSIVAIEITECQNGYARVGAVPDNSRCDPAGGRACVDTEQVLADYLTANPDVVVSTPPLDVGGHVVALAGREVDEGAAVAVAVLDLTGDDVVFAREPRFENGRLATTDNDCVPTCASGTQTDVLWVYVRVDDVFRTAASS